MYESGNDNSILIINGTTNNVTQSIILKWAPNFVSYDPSNNQIYAGNGEDGWQGTSENDMGTINGSSNRLSSFFNGGSAPQSIAFDTANGFMYIVNGNFGLSTISVINPVTEYIVNTITIPMTVAYDLYDPSNNCIYALGYYSPAEPSGHYTGYVDVINTTNSSIIKRIAVGYAPLTAAYDSINNKIYVANWYSNNLTVIDGSNNSVVSSIPTGKNPSFVEFDSQNGMLYVTDHGSNTTTVIDTETSTVRYNLSTPGHPDAVGIDPVLHMVLIAENSLNNITLIDAKTNRVMGNISVGDGPDSIIFDPQNNLTYVANWDSGTITIINFSIFVKAYEVTLNETGLPSGTQWNAGITFGGLFVTNGSTSSSKIQFNLANGTYSFNIPKVPGYSDSPENGTFAVNGSSAVFNITFRPTQFLGIPYTILIPAAAVSLSLIAIGTTMWLRRKRGN